MRAGDDPGQGFTLSEEVSKSNRVKTSTRGRGRLVPCCKVGRWVSCQEDPAGRKPFNAGADLVLIEMLICQRFLARHMVSFLRRKVFPDQERILIEKIMREKEKVRLEGSRK